MTGEVYFYSGESGVLDPREPVILTVGLPSGARGEVLVERTDGTRQRVSPSRLAELPDVPKWDLEPTYDRFCDWPGCRAKYDAYEVMSGKAKATGWRMLNRRVSMRLCDKHSLIWGLDADQHLPGEPGATMACQCGRTFITGDPAVTTNGHRAAAYIAHLFYLPGSPR
jgi:hypothetical protein